MLPGEFREILDGTGLAGPIGAAFERRGEPAPGVPSVDYVRWKPGTSCLLGIGRGRGTPCDLGYVKLFIGTDARTCVDKYRARERNQGWVEHVAEWNAALFRFPHDRAVAGLATLADMNKLKHVLHRAVPGWSPRTVRVRASRSTVRLIKYKPERRGLARVDLAFRREADGEKLERTVVAQAYADGSGRRVGPGRYFVRLLGESTSLTRTLTILR